jgi:hypothetical protein
MLRGSQQDRFRQMFSVIFSLFSWPQNVSFAASSIMIFTGD